MLFVVFATLYIGEHILNSGSETKIIRKEAS